MNCINSIQHPRPLIGSSFTPPDIAGLVQYVTFDTIYNTNGTPYTSGAQCCGNIATANTPTNVYPSISGATFDNTVPNSLIPGSVYSGKTNNSLFRWGGPYVFPDNTTAGCNGLSFSFWVYLTGLADLYGGPFGIGGTTVYINPPVADSFGFLALRFYGTAPYSVNLAVDQQSNTGGGIMTGVGAISLNTWHHLAWTISAAAYGGTATHKLYKNGTQIYSGTGVYPNNKTRIYNDIGTVPGWGTFQGNVDMFRYYSVELTSTDVTKIYTNLDRNITR